MAVMTVTKENFEKEVTASTLPVLVDFWAPWCGPCKMLSPVVDKIAEELTDIKVCKVNIDDEQELATRYGVMSIPTLVLIKDGKVADTSVGLRPKDAIVAMINKSK
ncbi:MAG: thioredoxin [Angelakisella sp.]